jgi:glutamate-1-semialdehyde 2,1-aminomutase
VTDRGSRSFSGVPQLGGSEHAAATETSPDWAARARAVIPGGTSTGSKRPDALYGPGAEGPTHFTRAVGCRLTTTEGAELIDCTMALGAVAFGYADPEVSEAVIQAVRDGHVAGLAHPAEVEVAEMLRGLVPFAESVRFLKSGAEGVAAAVRIARAHTGRSGVLGCGYFGWLDWCSDAAGVPEGTRRAFARIPFGEVSALEEAVSQAGADLAAIVIEPVVEREAPLDWLRAVRALCDSTGAVLIADEIKTGFRVATAGGFAARGVAPDLAVFGKAMANGYPLAAVCGRREVMAAAERTWISSTLAGERTALAAAAVVLGRHAREDVCGRLASTGEAMRAAARRAIVATAASGVHLEGIESMWFLRFDDPGREARVLREARRAGVLLKRGPYDFAALAHDADAIAALEWALTHALRAAETADA